MVMAKETDRNKPLYMIGVAADLAGLHPQTLRIYESKGLVVPQRTSGNTRMYSQADVDRVELVAQLTEEGINLAGVLRILDQKERISKLESELEEMRKELKVTQDKLHEMEVRNTIATLTKRDARLYLP
jgi:MerR family transcriptional regulator, heat shock protein HspR